MPYFPLLFTCGAWFGSQRAQKGAAGGPVRSVCADTGMRAELPERLSHPPSAAAGHPRPLPATSPQRSKPDATSEARWRPLGMCPRRPARVPAADAPTTQNCRAHGNFCVKVSRLLERFGASGKSTWSGWGCSLRAFMRNTSTEWLRRSPGGDLASCPPGPARARCWPPPPCRNFCSAATFSGLRRCPQRAQKS